MTDPTVPTQVSGSHADRPSLIPDYIWAIPDDRLSPGPLLSWAADNPLFAGIAGLLALGLLVLAVWGVRMAIRDAAALARYTIGGMASLARAWTTGRTTEDVLTIAAASIATGVSAQGMWRFFGDVLGLSGPLRLLLFAFIEVAVITSAVRAKRSMREKYSAGIDGIAVWALTCLSAVLSAMDTRSVAEAIFRLAAPLVAAWLWERGMALERRRATGLKGIHWRITPERILVRLGLADATDRTAEQVATQRMLTKVALAAHRARALRASGAREWRQRRASARLQRAYTRAAQHAGLARDTGLQEALAGEVAALYSAPALLEVAPASAWTRTHVQTSDAAVLAAELRQWSATVRERPDREALAAVASLAAHAAEQRVAPRPAPAQAPAQPQVLFAEPAATEAGGALGSATAPISAPHSEAAAPAAPNNSATQDAPVSESAADRMYNRWKQAVAEGRRPTGKELSVVGGCGEQHARRVRARWEET
ncbi:MAG: hypothetical protein DIU62_011400, partial [Pseudomonadota bacterium]